MATDDRLTSIEASIHELRLRTDEMVKLAVADRNDNALIAMRLTRVENGQREQSAALHGDRAMLHRWEARLAKQEGLLRSHDGKLHGIDEKLRSHDGRLHSIDEKLRSHDGRLHSIDEKLRSHDGRLHGIDETLRSQGDLLRSHDETLRDVKATQIEHSGLLYRILSKLEGPEERAE